jgi:MarR family transcriptional regulator, transcriptional regulator for hemolysin
MRLEKFCLGRAAFLLRCVLVFISQRQTLPAAQANGAIAACMPGPRCCIDHLRNRTTWVDVAQVFICRRRLMPDPADARSTMHRSGGANPYAPAPVASSLAGAPAVARMIEGPINAADLTERFENALYKTARAWRRAVDQRLKCIGMGIGRVSWMTIAAAARSRSPMSQSALADMLLVTDASMVRMIDCLANAGLVMRERSKSDRRVKRIVMTEAGHRIYSELKDEAAAAREQLLAPIGWEELAHLTALLEQLQSRLDP